MLVGVNEGCPPNWEKGNRRCPADQLAQRLEEERRLMYVGITRARNSLVVSWLKRRKRARVHHRQTQPLHCRNGLDQSTAREDPREKPALCGQNAHVAATTQPNPT